MEKTLGERRVRTDFNVSGTGTVDLFKQRTAELIDYCQTEKDKAVDGEQGRLWSLAQTSYEEAAGWAVKGATYNK
jgi:hypothetical protein